MAAVLQNIIELLTSGIGQMATGIGQGLSNLVQNIFLVAVGTGSDITYQLSTFGTVVIIFAGISLTIGLSRWVVGFVTSLGARN